MANQIMDSLCIALQCMWQSHDTALSLLLQWLLACVCVVAVVYVAFATFAMPFFGVDRRMKKWDASSGGAFSGVTVLKPLCGTEPRLYENLLTFCEQSLSIPVQLLFGVSHHTDPAIATVRRLQLAYPHLAIELVIDPTRHGTNLKVGNLINMASRIRHDVVVLADSDIAVAHDYLSRVIAPLARADVGIVTCLYRGRSVVGLWARIGALFINEWFVPSVRIAHTVCSRQFGFGATLALRRATLETLGGFAALKNQLADDYWLAEYTRALGLITVLSTVTVETDVIEPTIGALWTREIRWLRTIRSINFTGFLSLFITFTSPWLVIGAWLSHAWGLDENAMYALFNDLISKNDGFAASEVGAPVKAFALAAVVICGVVARILLHARSARHYRTFWVDLPLVPLRDLFLMLEWSLALLGSRVTWRGAVMFANNAMDEREAVSAIDTSHAIVQAAICTTCTTSSPRQTQA